MKKRTLLLPVLFLGAFNVSSYAQLSWGSSSIPTYTAGRVGIGVSAGTTTAPTDAFLHIFGQPHTTTCVNPLGVTVPAINFPTPELWIDRLQNSSGIAFTCSAHSANYFQISNTGNITDSHGHVTYGTTVLDVFNPSGWLGVLQPNPAAALDVNGNGLIEQNLTVTGNITGHLNGTIDRNLSVGLNATVAKNLTVGIDASVSNNLSVGVNANVNNNLSVLQTATVKNLNVTNDGTVHNDLTVNNLLTVHGGEISMSETSGDSWRHINAYANHGGLSLISGTGAYIELAGANEGSSKGAINLVSESASLTGNNGFNFYHWDGMGSWTNMVHIYNNGKVAIGSSLNPWNANGTDITRLPEGYLLYVAKGILTEKLKVQLQSDPWSDFVFNKDYSLMPLSKVESYVKANKHLPEIPSASEVTANGIDVAGMDAKLLQKIEELTLYVIQQQKDINDQRSEIETLKKKMN